ncbi:hypothetical protein TNCV_4626531 [Trichonephila clavipes]|nr:hypothetical protein TNCV_4626531 [Trichonephila clavipes]
MNRSPDRSFLIEFKYIPFSAFCMANCDSRDISLFGSDNIKKRELVSMLCGFNVGKTRLLPGHETSGSIKMKWHSSWRVSTHHGVQQGSQRSGQLTIVRLGA